jgi:hypothetical protein
LELNQELINLNKGNLSCREYENSDHMLNNIHDGMSRYPYLETDIIGWLSNYGILSETGKGIF